MKVVTLAAFGAGFVLGARAGRERYEQLVGLARRASENLDGLEMPTVRDRLDDYATRLEEYASRNNLEQGRTRAGSRGG